MKIIHVALLDTSLEFISTGGRVVHSRQTGMSPHDANLDLGKHTMCGRTLPDGIHARPERTLPTAYLCRRCIASLRTYTGGPARLNVTPMVRFEQTEVSA